MQQTEDRQYKWQSSYRSVVDDDVIFCRVSMENMFLQVLNQRTLNKQTNQINIKNI
jgi:hypothetical protein